MSVYVVLYTVILVSYGEIMYARGKRSVIKDIKFMNEKAKALLKEGMNNDETHRQNN